MGAEINSADINQKMDGRQDDKLQFHDSKTTDLKSPIRADSIIAGSLTEVTSFSEQISTQDTESSLTDTSLNANNTTEVHVKSHPKCGMTRAVSIYSPHSVEKDQPQPLCALLPSSTESCTVYEVSQSFTSISRSQDTLKTSVHAEPDGAVLLACLFCHPLDCLLATMRGCNECMWSLCSSVCGCECTALQGLVDITHHCDLCGCLGVRCFMCDCPFCDICLQATECLDLAMEISQMLYH